VAGRSLDGPDVSVGSGANICLLVTLVHACPRTSLPDDQLLMGPSVEGFAARAQQRTGGWQTEQADGGSVGRQRSGRVNLRRVTSFREDEIPSSSRGGLHYENKRQRCAFRLSHSDCGASSDLPKQHA
jgi:hypothetical protein